jgi:hypothetical protein
LVSLFTDNTSSILTTEGGLSDRHSDMATVEDNSLIDTEQIDDIFERQISDCPNSIDLNFGSMSTTDHRLNVGRY